MEHYCNKLPESQRAECSATAILTMECMKTPNSDRDDNERCINRVKNTINYRTPDIDRAFDEASTCRMYNKNAVGVCDALYRMTLACLQSPAVSDKPFCLDQQRRFRESLRDIFGNK